MLVLFYSFRDEKELLSDCPLLYQSKLQEQRIQEVANMNKIMFKPYSDLVDQTFSHFNETLINSQDPYSKIQIIKHQRQNITMETTQKARKRTKRLQFSKLCQQ